MPETRKVLIATDGSDAASAAMRVGRLMSARGEWTPSVLTVMTPLPVAVGDVVLPAPPSQYQAVVSDSIIEGIQRQLRRHGNSSWELSVEFGRPVPLIVQTARERKAELIVLGLGRHGRLGRFVGAETAARVLRHTDIPVYAVEASTRKRPHVALAAVDFSESSVRAAREAYALLEPQGRLHLVHVKWAYNMTSFADPGWERAYAVATEDEFARVLDGLTERADVDITTSLLTGNVVEKILSEARAVHADVIALGSHSQTVLDRLIIGSTPAELLRSSACSVLIAPPPPANARP